MLSVVDHVHPPKATTYSSESPPFFSCISSWLLDTAARLFSLPVPYNVNQQVVILMSSHSFCLTLFSTQTPDPLELDDSTVNTLVQSPEAVAWDDALRAYATERFVSTHKITPTLLAKYVNPSERENMS